MIRKIAVIGTGYVGLTVGVCLAYLGHKITCFDIDRIKIKNLQKGLIPIFEPGLEELLKANRKNIKFSTDAKKTIQENEIIFITVGTPVTKQGKIDLRPIREAVKTISKFINGFKVIVVKSTVPVGTTASIRNTIKKKYKGEFSIVSNPEFLREGSAVKDFLEPDRIIIGVEDKKAEEIMKDIYSSINAPKIIVDIKSAEMIKYAANAFLATKISFINEIANLCERVGADVKSVAEGIGYDKRIGKDFLKAGIGYGGSCFPKDILTMVMMANRHQYDFKLLKAVITVNKKQQKIFVDKIKKVLRSCHGKTVAIWGLAFKPNTDDIRKSPAINIIRELKKFGFKIKAYDPIAMNNAKKELSGIQYCRSALEAAKNADVLAIATEWPEFSEIDLKKLKQIMKHPYILDGRNIFEPEEMKKLGFYYQGIGRG